MPGVEVAVNQSVVEVRLALVGELHPAAALVGESLRRCSQLHLFRRGRDRILLALLQLRRIPRLLLVNLRVFRQWLLCNRNRRLRRRLSNI